MDSANGPRLTRAGTFARTSAGLLATIDGTPVLDARRQPVTLPEGGRVEIAAADEFDAQLVNADLDLALSELERLMGLV